MHRCLVEIDRDCSQNLRTKRPAWIVLENRHRAIIAALQSPYWEHFSWPITRIEKSEGVSDALYDWEVSGKKTSAFRQVGNTFSPRLARTPGEQINEALDGMAKTAGGFVHGRN